MPHVAFYITGHGFGHATRSLAVAAALAARRPGIRLTLLTTVPSWLLALNLPVPFARRAVALDVGVLQRDALRLDARGTLAAYHALADELPRLVETEAARLRAEGVNLIVADIPPAAFPIARRLGVPGVGISNFTWDWIYADYTLRHPEFQGVVETIRRDYACADLFLRLPFHGPCDAAPVVRDVPLVARRATRTSQEVRAALGLDSRRRLVLISFGGFDVEGIEFEALEQLTEYEFLVTQRTARTLRNVRTLPSGEVPYHDLIAAADVVVTKLGYGIVADCIANRTRMIYTARGQFAEYGPLEAGVQELAVSEVITNEDLLSGNWRAVLERVLARPETWPEVRVDGASVAADAMLELLRARTATLAGAPSTDLGREAGS